MPAIPDTAAFQKTLAALPLLTYQAGETVFGAGSKTGRLLILRSGGVAIVKDAIEIARVTEPGAVFGELSALLDQPHTADVFALESSQFHVADANTLLVQDPIALFYVATVLARRLVGANRTLIELKNQLQAGQPSSVIGKTVERMEGLLGDTAASLVYAGYPYNPYAYARDFAVRRRAKRGPLAMTRRIVCA
jgi:CRP-like cAMP-binding protein